MHSRLWFSCTLVTLSWLGFGLLQTGGLPITKPGGYLEVRSVPPGAEVFVNGQASGMTDGILAVTPGRLEIRVKKNGYGDASSTVDVSRSKTPVLAFELEPEDAKLEVKAEGGSYELWVGPGQPQKLEKHDPALLDPGLYEVWGVRNGLSSTRKTVRLKPGQTQQLSLSWNSTPAKSEGPMERPAPTPRPAGVPSAPPVTPPPASTVPQYYPPARPRLPEYTPPPNRPPVAQQPPRRPPPVYVAPQPVWTPIPAEHSAPPVHTRPDPAPVFTPLP